MLVPYARHVMSSGIGSTRYLAEHALDVLAKSPGISHDMTGHALVRNDVW